MREAARSAGALAAPDSGWRPRAGLRSSAGRPAREPPQAEARGHGATPCAVEADLGGRTRIHPTLAAYPGGRETGRVGTGRRAVRVCLKQRTAMRRRGFPRIPPRRAVCGREPSTVDNIQLRCRAHNGYEAERHFGQLGMAVVREETTAYAPGVWGSALLLRWVIDQATRPSRGEFQKATTGRMATAKFREDVQCRTDPHVSSYSHVSLTMVGM